MSDYFIGTDVLGADDWGVPVVIEDPAWGVPTEIVDPAWGVPVYVSGDDIALRSMMDVMKQIDLDRDFVVGMFDFNVEQRRMDSLKQVPVSVAQALLKGGMTAINGAIVGAKQPWYKPDLPGDTSRQNVLGKLLWHQNALAALIGKQNSIYASGEDLKHWVLQAFVEANAVEEGAAYMQAAWNTMWTEVAAAIAALPAEVRKVAGNVVQAVTGLKVWQWALIGGAVLLFIGGVIVAVARSRTGAAVAHAVTKRYLP